MNIDSYQYNLLARNPVISQDFVSGLTNGHREPPNNLDLNYTQVKDETPYNHYMMDLNVADVRVPTRPEVVVQKGEPSQNSLEPDLQDWFHCFKEMIFKPILKHPKSGPFRKPVDPVALGIFPAYNDVIKHPMDLGTIRRKMDNGVYKTRRSCIDDVMLVWNNALTFNPPMHFVYNAALEFKNLTNTKLGRIEKWGVKGALSRLKRSSARKASGSRVKKEPVRRRAPSSNFGRPRTHQPASVIQYFPQPQHKQVTSSNNGLKACETLLNNLLGLRNYTDFIEPFLYIIPQYSGHVPISLTEIERKLSRNQYRNYTEFAGDMRQMITDTYKYNHAESPIVTAAGKLQKEFELRFAKINFDDDSPTCPPIKSDDLQNDEDFDARVNSAFDFLMIVSENLDRLKREFYRKRQRKKNQPNDGIKEIKTESTHSGNGPQTTSSYVAKDNNTFLEMKSEDRKAYTQYHNSVADPHPALNTQHISAGYHPPLPKKPRIDSAPVLTVQEANEMKEQIGQLHPDQQLQILDILQKNGEELFPDEHGEVEIEISRCCAGSVRQVRLFLESLKTQVKEETAVTSTVGPVGNGNQLTADSSVKKSAGDRSSSDSDSSDSSSDSSESSSDSE